MPKNSHRPESVPLLILWVYTCWALVLWYQKDLTVCFIQQGIKFDKASRHQVWHILWFFAGTLIWYNTPTRKQRHIAYPCIDITCYLLILYYTEWIICWSQKFTSHNVFIFQGYSLAEVIYLLIRFDQTKSFLWNTKNTDRYSVRVDQQINFVMLNRFCLLSKKNPTPLFLMDNIKLDRIPTKIISNIHTHFIHCISSFEDTSYKHVYSLFQEEIWACAAVHMCYVMNACDQVRSIIFLPCMVEVSFLFVVLKKAECQWIETMNNLIT